MTDLVMVNMKGPDYTAHAYGPDSPEIKETLGELDRQMATTLGILNRKAGGPGRIVVAITADHGMPPEPAAGRRHYIDDIVTLIHNRFDPAEKKVVQYYGDAGNGQLHIDTARLRALNLTLKDVVALLEAQDFLVAAFTEDEVQAAQSRLPSMK
jgi:predicted AlkP superfamily pyrophosphatase or phosphodiesterase